MYANAQDQSISTSILDVRDPLTRILYAEVLAILMQQHAYSCISSKRWKRWRASSPYNSCWLIRALTINRYLEEPSTFANAFKKKFVLVYAKHTIISDKSRGLFIVIPLEAAFFGLFKIILPEY